MPFTLISEIISTIPKLPEVVRKKAHISAAGSEISLLRGDDRFERVSPENMTAKMSAKRLLLLEQGRNLADRLLLQHNRLALLFCQKQAEKTALLSELPLLNDEAFREQFESTYEAEIEWREWRGIEEEADFDPTKPEHLLGRTLRLISQDYSMNLENWKTVDIEKIVADSCVDAEKSLERLETNRDVHDTAEAKHQVLAKKYRHLEKQLAWAKKSKRKNKSKLAKDDTAIGESVSKHMLSNGSMAELKSLQMQINALAQDYLARAEKLLHIKEKRRAILGEKPDLEKNLDVLESAIEKTSAEYSVVYSESYFQQNRAALAYLLSRHEGIVGIKRVLEVDFPKVESELVAVENLCRKSQEEFVRLHELISRYEQKQSEWNLYWSRKALKEAMEKSLIIE